MFGVVRLGILNPRYEYILDKPNSIQFGILF